MAISLQTLRNLWDKLSPLQHRVITAAILGPIALLIIYFGGFLLSVVLVAGAILGHREFVALVPKSGAPKLLENTACATLAAAVLLCDFVNFHMGLLALVFGCVIVAIISHLYIDKGDKRSPPWLCFGVFYLGLPAICILWLRQEGALLSADYSWAAVILLFLQVWATDSFAYLAGRKIGGPKLAPSISPNKTVSGLVGGVIGSALTLAVGAMVFDAKGAFVSYLIIGAVLAVIAQAGDLFESHLKRRAGVKDSGTLIPGHGGLLDRIDGLLAAAPFFALAFHWLT